MVNFINVLELLTRKLVRFLIEASVEQRVGCFFGLLKTLLSVLIRKKPELYFNYELRITV